MSDWFNSLYPSERNILQEKQGLMMALAFIEGHITYAQLKEWEQENRRLYKKEKKKEAKKSREKKRKYYPPRWQRKYLAISSWFYKCSCDVLFKNRTSRFFARVYRKEKKANVGVFASKAFEEAKNVHAVCTWSLQQKI
jgi:hypothetical protein